MIGAKVMPSIKIDKDTWNNVPAPGDFGTLPIGKYPVRMKVNAYQTDGSGVPMTNGKGEPVFWTTSAGDPMWKLELEVLAPGLRGRKIFDQLSFGIGGLKRVKVLYVRGGFADETGDVNLVPEDLDGSYWNVDVDRHEIACERDGKTPKVSRYPFKRKDCTCTVCKQYDGKNVNVNARIAFAGFEPMPAKEAKQYAQPDGIGANLEGICPSCQKGRHHHQFEEDGCRCQHNDHPAF